MKYYLFVFVEQCSQMKVSVYETSLLAAREKLKELTEGEKCAYGQHFDLKGVTEQQITEECSCSQ